MSGTGEGLEMIHLNTAGQGRMPDPVRTVLTECVRVEDRFGPHELEERVGDLVHGEVHQRLERLLNTPDGHTELFTGGAAAFDALVSGLALGKRDRVWTTPYESAAHLATLRSVRDRTRCRLEVVPLRPDGDLDLDWMSAHIDDSVALVSVPHVPANRGIVNPVADIGRLLAPHRCLYAVDAAYSLGQLPVDIADIGCHLLTGDGWRFLRGPRSVGFAYVSARLRDALSRAEVADEAPRAAALASPVPTTAAVAAFASVLSHRAARPALSYEGLIPALRGAVAGVAGVELLAPGRRPSAMLAFHHPELSAALIRRGLAERGVAVRKTVADETPLLARHATATPALCVSLDEGTTQQDIDDFAEALAAVVAEIRPRRDVPRTDPARIALVGS
ncbi:MULTISPECIES: aminotransferase class V-fold PLP-dependent enzyme [unclassified Streptomyces]|uniref:aminotransferase class V-fold PLP-dependent enzyme n=1 Tax=unclassified Streptomyces TaxID=2593676 RepID=UPI000D0A9FDD|nr:MULTISPECIES: aminotransferase class V-fold PLP-dependent enzyme [unclassified Streptomyces]MYY00899.1 aminotransferase class V-fold PLP-dependent enzyme [Streptomyces sp. SID4913]